MKADVERGEVVVKPIRARDDAAPRQPRDQQGEDASSHRGRMKNGEPDERHERGGGGQSQPSPAPRGEQGHSEHHRSSRAFARFKKNSGILRDTHMSDEDLKAEVEKLRAENERLKTQRGRSVSLKVSEKGGVSVYGLGRFPVTLYKEQWTKLLAMTDEIRAFIKEHDAELKAKPEA